MANKTETEKKRDAKAAEDAQVLQSLVESGKLENAMEHDVDPQDSSTTEGLKAAETAREKVTRKIFTKDNLSWESLDLNIRPLVDDLNQQVKSRPWAFIAGAAVIGLLFGMRRSRR